MRCLSAANFPRFRLLSGLLLAFVLSGCIEFSPYEVETTERGRTAENIAALATDSSHAFTPFKFVLLSDSHADYENLRKAVARINRRDDISFVLHGGDLTDSGLLQEYEWTDELLSQLQIPYLTVIGNHDALNSGKQNYAAIYGEFDYSFVFNQVKFVALNSNSWEFDNDVPRLDWLAEQLGDFHLYRHQIVLTHILPQDDRFPPAIARDYQQILEENFVSLIGGGHSHNYHYTEEILSSGLPIGYLICGAIGKETYVVVSVEADGVSHQRVYF